MDNGYYECVGWIAPRTGLKIKFEIWNWSSMQDIKHWYQCKYLFFFMQFQFVLILFTFKKLFFVFKQKKKNVVKCHI